MKIIKLKEVLSYRKIYEKKKLLRITPKRLIVWCCIILFGFTPKTGFSQDAKVTITEDKVVSMVEVFELIKAQTNHTFIYKSDLFDEHPPVTLKKGIISVKELLDESLSGSNFTYRLGKEGAILLRHKNQLPQEFIKVQGKITDENGDPLPGATVLIKGTHKGITANPDGNYAIKVPGPKTVLVFSYVGFASQEVTVGKQTIINVRLEQSSTELDEVTINAGYYQMKKKTATSNIAQMKSKEIEQQPVSNPLMAMQGKMTGLDISSWSGVIGSTFNIQIRGMNSLRNNGNLPLLLVNGIPYPNVSFAHGGTIASGGVHPLNYINPNDIESIEVLKDADATAIYGSRGANGVILITTKKGKAGKTQIAVNAYTGFSSVSKKLDVLNLEQYLEMRNEAFANDGREPGPGDYDINGTWDLSRETDWQKELLDGTSKMYNVHATVSGGNEKTSFLVSTNYLKETTLFSDNFYDQKLSTNFNLDHSSANEKFDINFSGLYTIDDLKLFSGSNFISYAISLPPNAPALYNEDGTLNWADGTWNNQLAYMERTADNKATNWVANLRLSYEIFSGFKLKTNVGLTDIKSDGISRSPYTSFDPAYDPITTATYDNAKSTTWIVEPQAEYIRELGKGVFTALAGFTFQETKYKKEVIIGRNYTSDALLDNPDAAGEVEVWSYSSSEYRFNSVFGRLNYNFRDTYILNLTGRKDGSSRFGPGKKFANFMAVGAAYVFSNENLIKENFSFLNYGKVRVSYGSTGSDNIGDYQYLELWRTARYPYDNILGLAPKNLFNANFAWEKTTKFEVGLDLGFFDDRIYSSISYYWNESSNQLVGTPLPYITGFSSIQSNFPAVVRNTGLEIELSTVNIKSKDFTWSTDFNISIPNNKLVSFDNIENSNYANRYVVGKSLFIEKMFHFTGVDPETGIATFQDFDGDERISYGNDMEATPDLQKQFYGGLTNSIRYKNFTLDFTFRFVKHDQRNYLAFYNNPGSFSNQPVYVLDRWQQPGDITDTPRYTQRGEAYYAYRNFRMSDQTISDASFIRLQNLSLAYQLPTSLLQKLKLQGLKLYMQAQNLFTITNYKGWDPETGSRLPVLRIITFGVNITI